jgi:NitT/TauT family transport system substrate-binding protein
MNMRKSWTVALAGAALVLLVGYAVLRYGPGAQRDELQPLSIATNVDYAGSCPVFAASDQGYFEAEGLRVTIQPHSIGKAALAAALDGKADLATVGDLPIMFAAVSGRPVVVVASIFASEEDFGIVGRQDSGITTPSSLRGKRVGATFGTGGHFFLTSFLLREKLSVRDVTVVDLKVEDMAEALAQKRVDAVSVWEPILGNVRAALGADGLSFSGMGVYGGLFNLAGTRAFVAAHPEKMEMALRALTKGAKLCREAPSAAREITARFMKTEAASLERLWPLYRFQVTLDQALILALEDEARWAVKNRLTDRAAEVNFLDVISIDALKAVAPDAVTIIR